MATYFTLGGVNLTVLKPIHMDYQLNRPSSQIIGADGSKTNYLGSGGRLLTFTVLCKGSRIQTIQKLARAGKALVLISKSPAKYDGKYHVTSFPPEETDKGLFKIELKLQEDFVLNIIKRNFINYTVLPKSSSTVNVDSKYQITLNNTIKTIQTKEKKFRDVQGQHSGSVMEKVGYGDCWADSEWLYNKLSAVKIQVRIMGYVGKGTGIWYRHTWIQYNTGSGWKDWEYSSYGSQHYGDGLKTKSYVLIAYGKSPITTQTLINTGY